jgi:hypothetical protein
MKKWLAAFALFLPVTAGAYSTGTVFPTIVVDNTAGDQSRPRVSGNFASYNVVTTGGADIIGFFNFSTSTRGSVPSGADFVDNLSDISNSDVVFTRINISLGTSAIWKYSITSGTSSEVAPGVNPNRSNPSIGANTVAWEDVGVSSSMDPELVLTTNGTTTVRVTNDAAADQNPRVPPSGTMVVWEKCSANCDVYAALAPAWTPQAVANSAANETSPDTNGTQIVYASNAGGTEHVYVTTLGGATTQIPSTTVTQDHPAIANSFVAFEGGTAGSRDIFVFDLLTGVTHQITNTPADDEILSDITVSGTTVRVVWMVEGGATGFDVYATEFSVASPPPQLITDLINTIDSFNLQPGIANSLEAKLNAAQASLAAGNTTAACNEIDALINEVQAQSGKKLTPGQASAIIAAAQAIRTALGCP